ncbi:MAG: 50S ribosomal protein L21 [Clostridia bacterium]|nr:50S ribosomal protein L21 [Clostridia bacterium]
MNAIIETGGKQYSVNVGDVLQVEKLEKNIGDKIIFDALFINDESQIKFGKNANNVKVSAEVTGQGKADKIIVFKYNPKKRTRKKYGHRQPFTEIKITEIK